MKNIPTFENFLNEAKELDLKLSTFEYPSGTVARFRIESDSINLRKVVNLSKEPWSKKAKSFTDNEIGFESAGDRKLAMSAIQKSFDSGKNDVREFLNESFLNEGAILKAINPGLEGDVKVAVGALEKLLISSGAILDYKHADKLANCIIDIIDAAKQEARDEYSD
jgi:hypothetical protein